MSLHTLRGQMQPSSKRVLIIDDGRLNHGMKIKEFHVWGIDNDSSAEMTLNLNEENVGTNFNASNGNQIAWASQTGAAGVPTNSSFSLIDPNHVVVQDLVLNNFGSTTGNYLVILEQVTLSDDQAILALIKERQQDDL